MTSFDLEKYFENKSDREPESQERNGRTYTVRKAGIGIHIRVGWGLSSLIGRIAGSATPQAPAWQCPEVISQR